MKYLISIMTLALLAITSSPAMAQCGPLVGAYTSWLANQSPEPVGRRKVVGFTIVTNQSNDQPANDLQLPSHNNNFDAVFKSDNSVSYGIGNLIKIADGDTLTLVGNGQFYFNDRTSNPAGSLVYTGFTGRTDPIRLVVLPNGTVRITLQAWGNGVVQINARCENDVMFGFSSSVGGNSRPAMYVLSFSKRFIPQ